MISHDTLFDIISYDKITGIAIWKYRSIDYFSNCKNPSMQCDLWNTVHFGAEIGSRKLDGKTKYLNTSITINGDRIDYRLHRLIWFYVTGKVPDKIDHIDGDGLNNKWKNLRSVTIIKNLQNQRINKNNKSGFNGVCWNIADSVWIVYIGHNCKQVYGGRFKDLDDAINKRKQMNVEYGYHELHGANKKGIYE